MADEAIVLTSESVFPRAVHTSHLSNQQVNHCGAAVRQSTERPLQSAHSSHHPAGRRISKKKNLTQCFHCKSLLFVESQCFILKRCLWDFTQSKRCFELQSRLELVLHVPD